VLRIVVNVVSDSNITVSWRVIFIPVSSFRYSNRTIWGICCLMAHSGTLKPHKRECLYTAMFYPYCRIYCKCHTLHAVYPVYDTTCIAHEGSMAPHAACMRGQWRRMHPTTECIPILLHRKAVSHLWFSLFEVVQNFYFACTMQNDKACKIRFTSRIRIYIEKGFSPLIRVPGPTF
jgi:hypothetical protein